MRTLDSNTIRLKIIEAIAKLQFDIDADILKSFSEAKITIDAENKWLAILKENAELASRNKVPLCQDTGTLVAFVRLGHRVVLEQPLAETINQAVTEAYEQLFLRKSIVADPFKRINTQKNTPAVIHYEIVDGDSLTISLMAKGGGSENASALWMLEPSTPWEEIEQLVLGQLSLKGLNACPPLILGIAVGGNFETCPLLAKKALLRKIGERNHDSELATKETTLIAKANNLGIGVGGFPGNFMVMDVFIEVAPCHIASLPVALNISCHSSRHETFSL